MSTARRPTKRYERLPLTGGLLNHDSRGQLSPKPLALSREAPIDCKEESDYQIAFFSFLRLNAPREPTHIRAVKRRNGQRDVALEPALGTAEYEAYTSHPLYVLTRVRHWPNGGHRHDGVAAQLHAEGVRPGALDVYLDAARGGFHGCRIELKSAAGSLSPEQLAELRWLRKEGYYAHVGYSDAEAISLLITYLSLPFSLFRGLPVKQFVRKPSKGGHDSQCPDCAHRLAWWF